MSAFIVSYNPGGGIVDNIPIAITSNINPLNFDIDVSNNILVTGSYLQSTSDLLSLAPKSQDGFITKFIAKNQSNYYLPSTLPTTSAGFQKIITNASPTSINVNIQPNYSNMPTRTVVVNSDSSLNLIWTNQQWSTL